MKKVTAFIGTETRKGTYRAVRQFEQHLKQYEEIDFEYVWLSDYHLEFCRGCKLCFDKGEQYCLLQDDRDVLLQKMEDSDGIVFATPNYAFQVTARMKNLLDRLAFLYHRPRFFGKAGTAIVVQGIAGGGDIARYLCTSAEHMGFHSSKGCCARTLEPTTEKQERALSREMESAARRFHAELQRPAPRPSFFRLMAFRLARTGVKSASPDLRDYQHFRDMGWFESAYFYPTSLGPVKTLAGHLFDLLGREMVKRM